MANGYDEWPTWRPSSSPSSSSLSSTPSWFAWFGSDDADNLGNGTTWVLPTTGDASDQWYGSDVASSSEGQFAWLATPIVLALAIFGLTTNVWYLILVASRQRLATMNYIVLVGQAVIDLVFGCASGINSILGIAYNNGHQYPENHCKLQGFWLMFPIPASIMHFALISWVRRYNVVNARGGVHAYSTHGSNSEAPPVAASNLFVTATIGGGARTSPSVSPASSPNGPSTAIVPKVISARDYIRKCMVICIVALLLASTGYWLPFSQYVRQPSGLCKFHPPK
jgi:hypothetical protein